VNKESNIAEGRGQFSMEEVGEVEQIGSLDTKDSSGKRGISPGSGKKSKNEWEWSDARAVDEGNGHRAASRKVGGSDHERAIFPRKDVG